MTSFTPKIPAVKEAGGLRIVNRTLLDRQVAGFRDGQPLEVIIRPYQALRPEWLRPFYFGYVVDPLAKWIGCGVEDMHEYLKRRFAWVPEYPEIAGVESTTQMSTARMWEYIEEIMGWAASDPCFVVPHFHAAHSSSRFWTIP